MNGQMNGQMNAPIRRGEWPTHLVYKRCRGGRVTVEL
jgi:hypothetical protein